MTRWFIIRFWWLCRCNSALGCDFVFGGAPISETCPVSCNDCPVYGCTDINACNFDATATEDDGSCQGLMTQMV